ncbi:MAG: pentapeptide repeat-containing protein [Blautia sp.]
MNEILLKDRILEELSKRAKDNEILKNTHKIDRYKIKELIDILFRLLHAKSDNNKLNDSSGIFSAMEKRYIGSFDNDGDCKNSLEAYNKDIDAILKKIYSFIDYKYQGPWGFRRHLMVMLQGNEFRENRKQTEPYKYLAQVPSIIDNDLVSRFSNPDTDSSIYAEKIVYGDSLHKTYIYRNKQVHNLPHLSRSKAYEMFDTVTEAYLCCVYYFKDKLDEKLPESDCKLRNDLSENLIAKWNQSIVFPEESEVLLKDGCINLEIRGTSNRRRRGSRTIARGTVREALEDILRYRQALKVLIGPPGSGKTSCLAQFREFCIHEGKDVSYFKLDSFVEKQCRGYLEREDGLDHLIHSMLDFMGVPDVEKLEGRILLLDEFENIGLDGDTAGKLLRKIYDEWIGVKSRIHDLKIVIACRQNFLNVDSRNRDSLSFIDIAPVSSFSCIKDIGEKLSWNCFIEDAILGDYSPLLGIPQFGLQFFEKLQSLEYSDEEVILKNDLFLLFYDMTCDNGMIQNKKYDQSNRESSIYIENDIFDLLNEFQREIAFYMLKEKSQDEDWICSIDEAKKIYSNIYDILENEKRPYRYGIDFEGKLTKRDLDFNYIVSAGLFRVDYEENTFDFLHSDLGVFWYSDKLIEILLPEDKVCNHFDTIVQYLSDIQLESINIKEYFQMGIEQFANSNTANKNEVFSIFDTIAETLIWVTLKGYKTVTQREYEETVERKRLLKNDNCLFVNCLTLLNWTNEILGKDIIWENYKERERLNSAVRNMIFIINANHLSQVNDTERENGKIKLSNMKLDQINLSRLYLGDAEIESSELAGAVFNECNLTYACFKNTTLQGALFTNIFATDLKFYDSDLQKTDFREAVIYDTQFINSEMPAEESCINFSYAKLENVLFRAYNLKNADFHNAELNRVSFRESNLKNSDFNHAILRKIDFQEVDLTGVKGLESCVFENIKMNRSKLSCNEDYVLQITKEQFKNMVFDEIIIVDSEGEEHIMKKEDDIENTVFFYE